MSRLHNFYIQLKYKKGDEINHQLLFTDFYDKNNKKIKILFVSPRMDEFGFNSHIVPAIFLMKNGKYCCSAISNIDKSKQELETTVSNFMLKEQMIKDSQIIVFPFLHEDLSTAYKAIRAINKDCHIVYTVDYNYYNIPDHHLKHELFKNEKVIEAVERNILYSDKTFIPSKYFATLLREKMAGKYAFEKNIYVEVIDPYITAMPYQDIDFTIAQEIEKDFGTKRIGIISTWYNKHYIDQNKALFDHIVTKYGKRLQLVFWGVEPFEKEQGKLDHSKTGQLVELELEKRKYRVFSKEPYSYHHKNLYNLNLDAVVYLAGDDEFTKHNPPPKIFFDAIHYNQVVISNYQSELFTAGEHYLYGSDIKGLKEQVDKFMKHDNMDGMTVLAKKHMFEQHGFSGDKIESSYLSFEKQ